MKAPCSRIQAFNTLRQHLPALSGAFTELQPVALDELANICHNGHTSRPKVICGKPASCAPWLEVCERLQIVLQVAQRHLILTPRAIARMSLLPPAACTAAEPVITRGHGVLIGTGAATTSRCEFGHGYKTRSHEVDNAKTGIKTGLDQRQYELQAATWNYSFQPSKST